MLKTLGMSFLILLLASPVLAQVEISACGQYSLGEAAFLGGDLDCSGEAESLNRRIAIHNTTLELRGHTFRGEDLFCENCQIIGPGKVEAHIYAYDACSIDGVTVTNAAFRCVDARRVSAHGLSRLTINGSTIDGCDQGILAERLTISNSLVSNASDVGVIAVRLKIRDSTFTGNGVAIEPHRKARLKDVVVEGSTVAGIHAVRPHRGGGNLVVVGGAVRDNLGSGIRYEVAKVKLVDTSITGNGYSGIILGPVSSLCDVQSTRNVISVKRSVIEGNGSGCGGASPPCADIDCCPQPRFRDSTCDHSHVSGSGNPGMTWGVCSLD